MKYNSNDFSFWLLCLLQIMVKERIRSWIKNEASIWVKSSDHFWQQRWVICVKCNQTPIAADTALVLPLDAPSNRLLFYMYSWSKSQSYDLITCFAFTELLLLDWCVALIYIYYYKFPSSSSTVKYFIRLDYNIRGTYWYGRRDWTYLLITHNLFYLVTDNSWVVVWQNSIWHESVYEERCIIEFIHAEKNCIIHWPIMATKQWM